MLYGFGDDAQPLPETLDLVEGVVLDYVTTLLHKVGGASVRPAASDGRRLWACEARAWCSLVEGVLLTRRRRPPALRRLPPAGHGQRGGARQAAQAGCAGRGHGGGRGRHPFPRAQGARALQGPHGLPPCWLGV